LVIQPAIDVTADHSMHAGHKDLAPD
jgi:hypothetical protein